MLRYLAICIICSFASLTLFSQPLDLYDLRIEHQTTVLGTAVQQPRFSWKLSGEGYARSQTAYQIQVDQQDLRGKKRKRVWDSQKTISQQSHLIPYGGAALQPQKQYLMRVRVWNEKEEVSAWSDWAYWETGFFSAESWQAQWITPDWEPKEEAPGPAPMLRRSFQINKPIAAARLYISSLGLYEAHLNGQKVGDALFTPGWTAFQERVQYQTFDVTGMVQRGENVMGALLGDGWYRGYIGFRGRRNFYGKNLALLAQLEITHTDGSKTVVASDENWQAKQSAIRFSDLYWGECFDARMWEADWATVGYQGKGWQGVRQHAYPLEQVVAQEGPFVSIHERIQPVEQITSPKEETIFDLGQNMVGRIQFTAKGSAGDTLRITHAEVLDKDGNFYTANLRFAKQELLYVFKGSEPETYAPHFSFMGFRYVKVEGVAPEDIQLSGEVIHSEMAVSGTFTCSDSLINQLQHNILWGQKGNFLDVPTDCPQRDERLGWTGDAQAFNKTAAFNMEVIGFFRKWLADLALDQAEDGLVPWVIPNALNPRQGASTGWADAATIIPWDLYVRYGDRDLLERQYPSMVAWVNYMVNEAGEDHLWNTGFHFGDWLFYSPQDDRDGKAAITDKYLIAQSFFAHSVDLLRKSAEVLGKAEDARQWDQLYRQVIAAYRQEYVTPSGRLVSGTQTAYVLALSFDLLPPDRREAAAARLAENVKSYNHLTTGFLGTPLLCHVLADYGYLDLAYQLLLNKDYPSWLYPVTKGATTIWERWDGIRPDGSFQNVGMNSFNHYAYGAIGDFLYRRVAGIQAVAEAPAYQQIHIEPLPGPGLTQAEAEFNSPYGPIISGWEQSGDGFLISVTIPVNATAEVHLPFSDPDQLRVNGQELADQEGLSDLRTEEGKVVLSAGSGEYRFWGKE